jgi:hypothetical protein
MWNRTGRLPPVIVGAEGLRHAGDRRGSDLYRARDSIPSHPPLSRQSPRRFPAGNVAFENERDSNGDYFVWLPRDVLTRLNRLRERSENHSDAILRVVMELGADQ